MYIIHDEMVEGPENFNGSAFWFEQLDTLYTGDEAFEKVEYTDPYEMILQNKDKIKGAVIYHERLSDNAMASRDGYPTRYGDMALLNLTLMMCGQYEAVALNYIQYNTLKEEYGLELEILGDTTKFMEKGSRRFLLRRARQPRGVDAGIQIRAGYLWGHDEQGSARP